MKKPKKSKMRFTALLATGDQSSRDELVKLLEQHKFQVTVVDSCKRALEHLLDHTFDVVIFDPEIAELRGSDALQLFKKIRPETPIIVTSDEKSYDTEVKIARTGVYFRLAKPIDATITKELMRSLENRIKKV
ncbi:MAG: response regulator [bacterium]